MGWYSKVQQDISEIPDAILYFENEMLLARQECKLTGSLEKAAAAMPGIVEHRFGQLQEIEAILEFLNIECRKIRSRLFRKYLESYNRALSSRDCEKFVDGEDDVINHEQLINEFALLRNRWLGVLKSLDQKQWQLTNIIKLRVAGLDDASL